MATCPPNQLRPILLQRVSQLCRAARDGIAQRGARSRAFATNTVLRLCQSSALSLDTTTRLGSAFHPILIQAYCMFRLVSNAMQAAFQIDNWSCQLVFIGSCVVLELSHNEFNYNQDKISMELTPRDSPYEQAHALIHRPGCALIARY